MTSDRRILLALFSLAFGLRVLYAAVIGSSPEINPDPLTYDYLISAKISDSTEWIVQPFTPRAPGYFLFLAGIFAITGAKLWTVILVHAALGGLTVLLLYRLGEKCLGRGIGLLSALWLSVYVHHMHNASQATRDTLATLLFVLLAYNMCRYFRLMRGALWTGLVFVLLVHVNPQYLFFLPFLALAFLFFATRHRLLNTQYLFIFLGTVFLLSTPWTIRNYAVYGDFVPIGLEASRYSGPVAGIIGSGSESSDIEKAGQMPKAKRPGFGRNLMETSRVVKTGGDYSGSNSGPEAEGWSLRHNLISLINYGLMIPFFLAGIIIAFREKNKAAIILAAGAAGHLLINGLYGGSERARMPFEPILILLAFYGLTRLARMYQIRKTRGTAARPA